MDVACGKGGDFSKWTQARLSFVFGVDVSPDNITNRVDGACARYLNLRKSTKVMPSALFVVGDSQFNIRKGATMSDKAKKIVASVFGSTSRKEASELGKGVERHYAVGEDGFNVTSCQFALHYFFKSTPILHRFLRNVAECTKVGGYFIGTCYDGKRIFNMLKDKVKEDSVELHHKSSSNKTTKIWGVKKQYDSDVFDDDSSSVGYTISVYQETINKEFDEYLVNFEYLTRLMENYGFQVLSDVDAQRMGLPSGCGLFEDLYNQMMKEHRRGGRAKHDRSSGEYGTAHMMTDMEKEISFKNRYFVFKKMSAVNLDKVAAGSDATDEVVQQVHEEEEEQEEEEGEQESGDKEEEAEEAVVPTPRKRVITVVRRKPRKLNKSIVLVGSSS